MVLTINHFVMVYHAILYSVITVEQRDPKESIFAYVQNPHSLLGYKKSQKWRFSFELLEPQSVFCIL